VQRLMPLVWSAGGSAACTVGGTAAAGCPLRTHGGRERRCEGGGTAGRCAAARPGPRWTRRLRTVDVTPHRSSRPASPACWAARGASRRTPSCLRRATRPGGCSGMRPAAWRPPTRPPARARWPACWKPRPPRGGALVRRRCLWQCVSCALAGFERLLRRGALLRQGGRGERPDLQPVPRNPCIRPPPRHPPHGGPRLVLRGTGRAAAPGAKRLPPSVACGAGWAAPGVPACMGAQALHARGRRCMPASCRAATRCTAAPRSACSTWSTITGGSGRQRWHARRAASAAARPATASAASASIWGARMTWASALQTCTLLQTLDRSGAPLAGYDSLVACMSGRCRAGIPAMCIHRADRLP